MSAERGGGFPCSSCELSLLCFSTHNRLLTCRHIPLQREEAPKAAEKRKGSWKDEEDDIESTYVILEQPLSAAARTSSRPNVADSRSKEIPSTNTNLNSKGASGQHSVGARTSTKPGSDGKRGTSISSSVSVPRTDVVTPSISAPTFRKPGPVVNLAAGSSRQGGQSAVAGPSHVNEESKKAPIPQNVQSRDVKNAWNIPPSSSSGPGTSVQQESSLDEPQEPTYTFADRSMSVAAVPVTRFRSVPFGTVQSESRDVTPDDSLPTWMGESAFPNLQSGSAEIASENKSSPSRVSEETSIERSLPTFSFFSRKFDVVGPSQPSVLMNDRENVEPTSVPEDEDPVEMWSSEQEQPVKDAADFGDNWELVSRDWSRRTSEKVVEEAGPEASQSEEGSGSVDNIAGGYVLLGSRMLGAPDLSQSETSNDEPPMSFDTSAQSQSKVCAFIIMCFPK